MHVGSLTPARHHDDGSFKRSRAAKDKNPFKRLQLFLNGVGGGVWLLPPCAGAALGGLGANCRGVKAGLTKKKADAFRANGAFFCGGSEALLSLKGRQYSIMCQNRIRGLQKPQPPVRGRCFILPTLQIFSWCLC